MLGLVPVWQCELRQARFVKACRGLLGRGLVWRGRQGGLRHCAVSSGAACWG